VVDEIVEPVRRSVETEQRRIERNATDNQHDDVISDKIIVTMNVHVKLVMVHDEHVDHKMDIFVHHHTSVQATIDYERVKHLHLHNTVEMDHVITEKLVEVVRETVEHAFVKIQLHVTMAFHEHATIQTHADVDDEMEFQTVLTHVVIHQHLTGMQTTLET
jgi:hypothetical protein